MWMVVFTKTGIVEVNLITRFSFMGFQEKSNLRLSLKTIFDVEITSYLYSLACAIVITHWFCLREESESPLSEFLVWGFFLFFFPAGSKKSRCGTNACPKTSKPVDSNNNDGPLSSPEFDGLVINAHGVPVCIWERTERKIRSFSSIYNMLLRPCRKHRRFGGLSTNADEKINRNAQKQTLVSEVV